MKNLVYITSGDSPPTELNDLIKKFGQISCITSDGTMPSAAPDIVFVETDCLSPDFQLPAPAEAAQSLGIPIVLVNTHTDNYDGPATLLECVHGLLTAPFLPDAVEKIIQSMPVRSPMADIVKGALQAAIYVLEATTGSTVIQNLKAPIPVANDGGYAGTISLSGDVDGSLTVLLPAALASITAAAILGCKPEEVEKLWVIDAVGEITNQVAGRMRTELSREGRNIVIAIPEVKESKPWNGAINGPDGSYNFECQEFPFILQLSIKLTAKTAVPT